MRGEYLISSLVSFKDLGSPLLARGVLKKLIQNFGNHRITPACAGSTKAVFCGSLLFQDQPCLRGEYNIFTFFFLILLGSPLLARGVRFACLYKTQNCRITPACAGSTLKRSLKIKLFILIFLKIY